MIPDSFFKINSDAKSNSLAGIGRDEKRPRIEIPPDKKQEFGRILSNKEKQDSEDDAEHKTVKDEDALTELGDAELSMKKHLAQKKTPAPFLDITNQTETIAKDSKVAPKLGKEKPVAPSEQPWSEPYVEKAAETDAVIKGAPVPKEKGEFADMQQQLSDSPAMLFSRMAKEVGTPLKHMQLLKAKLSEFVPKRSDLEVTYKKEDVETGFSLIPVKIQDQDIALMNLAVIALSPTDLLIDASKLRPVVKIPPYIMDLVEKITNEMKPEFTKTVITLRNAGMFNGAEVTITSFHTAKSELNIQFANLSQEAKSVLEMNLDALKQAMNDKGHVVHIISATTLKEEPVASANPSKEKNPEDQQEQKQKQKQNQEQEENA